MDTSEDFNGIPLKGSEVASANGRSPTCPFCDTAAVADTEHVLWRCSALSDGRPAIPEDALSRCLSWPEGHPLDGARLQWYVDVRKRGTDTTEFKCVWRAAGWRPSRNSSTSHFSCFLLFAVSLLLSVSCCLHSPQCSLLSISASWLSLTALSSPIAAIAAMCDCCFYSCFFLSASYLPFSIIWHGSSYFSIFIVSILFQQLPYVLSF